MCAGPQGSDLLTINDKVSGIFRVKDISCHADPAFQNGLWTLPPWKEQTRGKFYADPHFQMSQMWVLDFCTLHTAPWTQGLGAWLHQFSCIKLHYVLICTIHARRQAQYNSTLSSCRLAEGLAQCDGSAYYYKEGALTFLINNRSRGRGGPEMQVPTKYLSNQNLLAVLENFACQLSCSDL